MNSLLIGAAMGLAVALFYKQAPRTTAKPNTDRPFGPYQIRTPYMPDPYADAHAKAAKAGKLNGGLLGRPADPQ